MKPSRYAIVAVHGIGPAQRYALQDEVAENLVARLPGDWEKSAFFPPGTDGMEGLKRGSALRLQRKDCADTCPTFDVYEGYWSPIDKNRTSVRSVLAWLLNALFAPLNAVTPLPAVGAKLAFDLWYVAASIVLVFALPLVAFAALGIAYADVSADRFSGAEASQSSVLHMIESNARILAYGFEGHYLLALCLGAAGWYIVAHVVASIFGADRRSRRDHLDFIPWQRTMRAVGIAFGAVLIAFSWSAPLLSHANFKFRWEPLLLLVAALLFKFTFTLARSFFVNRLGDIQIYTTGDYNSTHYYLRDRILDTVESALARVLTAQEHDAPYYDRVYVVAHSLGSTIAMDALIHLRQAVEAGDIPVDAWSRVKAFVTLGTALEKTRFFFSSRNPTLTESFQHWRNDLYGRLFTCDPRVLWSHSNTANEHVIFWANYWYFRDIVANHVVTYRGTEDAEVCYNIRLREEHPFLARPWVHSDYLGDPHFWDGVDFDGNTRIGVIDILTASVEASAFAGGHR